MFHLSSRIAYSRIHARRLRKSLTLISVRNAFAAFGTEKKNNRAYDLTAEATAAVEAAASVMATTTK